MFERPRPRRSTLAAGILAGAVLYAVSSIIIDQISFDHVPDDVHRSLRSGGGLDDNNQLGQPHVVDGRQSQRSLNVSLLLHSFWDNLVRFYPSRVTRRAPRMMESRGLGPTLKGMHGQVYNFDTENFPTGSGVTWFNALSSPKVQWNIASYRWDRCPDGEKMYLGQTGFSFHEAPAPDDPDARKAPSKYLKFRIQKVDSRECLFNYSRTCLAGGSFIMNFGKTARNMLLPGDFSLKTATGKIRIVAFNTIRACSVQTEPVVSSASARSLEKTPLDYLRDSVSSTVDEEECRAWIKGREAKDDLFAFNSDLATVHVDTPWMKIVVQVRQNKVTTEEMCVFAGMNVWITNLSPGVLEDEFGGVLGVTHDFDLQNSTEPAIAGSRALSRKEAELHEVDGPFSP